MNLIFRLFVVSTCTCETLIFKSHRPYKSKGFRYSFKQLIFLVNITFSETLLLKDINFHLLAFVIIINKISRSASNITATHCNNSPAYCISRSISTAAADHHPATGPGDQRHNHTASGPPPDSHPHTHGAPHTPTQVASPGQITQIQQVAQVQQAKQYPVSQVLTPGGQYQAIGQQQRFQFLPTQQK